MAKDEWIATYVRRFLKGPWIGGDMTDDADLQLTARDCAETAYEDDPTTDPMDAAIDELSEWHD